MIAFFKCSVATLILFCLRLKASEEGDKSVLRIDASFTRRFFINLVKSILKFNQEYYRCDNNITKGDVNVLYDIDIYGDVVLDKILDKIYKSADSLSINYTDLATDIDTFLKLLAVNNRIKAYLKLSNNDLNISDGSFTKFIDENVENNDHDTILLKLKAVNNLIESDLKHSDNDLNISDKGFAKFINENVENNDNNCKGLKRNAFYKSLVDFYIIFNKLKKYEICNNLEQLAVEYTHFADYYLNILKLCLINNLDTNIIKNELKLNITLWTKYINNSKDYKTIFPLECLHVGTNLCHSFEVSSDIDKKNSTVDEHFNSVTTDIIKFKFETLETFTNNHYNTTENFCLYIEDLKRTQLSKFNSHGVNSGCIDATFRFLHKNLPCWLFKYVFECPCLLTMNFYHNTQDLQNKFIKRAKLINNDAFDNCYDDYGVNFLACILIDE